MQTQYFREGVALQSITDRKSLCELFYLTCPEAFHRVAPSGRWGILWGLWRETWSGRCGGYWGDLGVDNGCLWSQCGDLFEFELSGQIVVFRLLILSTETTVAYVLFSFLLSSKYFLISVFFFFYQEFRNAFSIFKS